jgi:hypothetical protein
MCQPLTLSRPLCRHCGPATRRVANRPLGLCCRCYYTPGVREQYPSTSPHARRGHGAGVTGERPLPPEPTDAAPGTSAKVAALEQRARLRQQLWHPDDRPFDADALPPREPGRNAPPAMLRQRLLALMDRDDWTPGRRLARRLGMSYQGLLKALAELCRCGLAEVQFGKGFRRCG